MTIEEIKSYFSNRPVYTFSGTKEELQEITGGSFTVLITNGTIYFCVSSDETYTPTDNRMELV